MKTVKRIFLYSVLVILMFYVLLVNVNLEGQLAIPVFAQERETIFEGFDAQMDSFVDAMTDEKSGTIFVFFGPIYMAIYGHNDFTIWSYGNYMNFAPDATHLIRVEGNKPFSLIYRDKLNGLTWANREEAESVIQALVKGEEINLRYYEDKGNRYNQVDSKLQNNFLGFVYCKAANLFGWKDLGVSPELPPVKLNYYAPTKPGIKSYACIDVQGNPDLMLINNKAEASAFNYSTGAWNASIMVGKEQGFGLSSDGEWICRGGNLNLFAGLLGEEHLIIRDSNGIIVFKEVLKWTGTWPGGETAAKKAWEFAPLGSIDIEGDGKGKVLLYGFRELWKWGVDNLNFPSLDDDVQTGTKTNIGTDSSPQVFLSNSQWDLGLISQGDLPTFAFTIENKGELILVINKIDASEYVQYDVEIPLNILPGEKQEVIFTYDSRKHDLGEVRESIRIYCNDPRKKAFSLRIKGYIKEKSTPTESISPVGTETTYSLTGSLHCPDKTGYACPSCSTALGYDNHFKGFNVLTTNKDCYVKLTYNDGDYIGNQNNCEVTIKGEKWLGLEDESGTKLVEVINKGNFNFASSNKFVEKTMSFPEDNYKYEFANEGKEFRLYLPRNREEAFKAVPWQNIVIEIKNKETNNVFKYTFEKGIFPLAYSWSNGVANYGQCVWWTAKRWVEEVDPVNLFPFYPPSPQDVNVIKIDSNYQPKRFDVLINYNPGGPPEHYGFVEKVEGDQVYITQFNFIPPGEVYNYVLRTWNRNATSLFYSNNFYNEYYFKYYYRK